MKIPQRREEQVELLEKVSDSAKRYGTMLDDRHINRLVRLALEGQGDEAVAAAALMGSLNLPNSELLPLLLKR